MYIIECTSSILISWKGGFLPTPMDCTSGESRRESKMKDTYFLFPIHAGMVVTGLTAEIDGRVLKAKVMERCETFRVTLRQTDAVTSFIAHGPAVVEA